MASAPQTPAPSTSLPASSGKVSSEDIISQKVSEQLQGRPAQGSRRADWVRVRDTQTDLCISNAIVKTGIGFSSGVLISVLLFRRRAWPVWLGTGFGLGSGWTDCERSFNPVAIPGVRVLPSPHHQSAPSSGSPSIMEKLSAKTSDLIDTGKSKGEAVVEKGKEKAREVEDKVSRGYGIRSALEPAPQDCMSCRLIGFATLTFLSAYSFKEAAQLGYFSRRPSSTPRVRGAMLVVFGIASGVGGVYRLIN